MDEGHEPVFDPAFRADFARLLEWRRDVRRFETTPLPGGTFERLVAQAACAPSVGLSQPWRFVLVESAAARRAVRNSFERCNEDALSSLSGERAALYARLKLAGLDEAPCQFALFCDRATRKGHGLGCRTMPQTLDYSTVMALHTLWLAARAEGIGLGWVSILNPDEVRAALTPPAAWHFIGYFCVGYPRQSSNVPELESAGWEERAALPEILCR